MSRSTLSESRPRPTAAERANRDRAIGLAAVAGEPLPDLATRYGLSVKQTRRIARAFVPKAAFDPPVEEIDVDALLREAVDAHAHGLSTCRTILRTGAPNAKIGAARTVAPLAVGMYNLLGALGLVLAPDALYARRKDDEVRRFLSGFFAVLDRRGIEYDEIETEVLAAVENAKAIPTWTAS